MKKVILCNVIALVLPAAMGMNLVFWMWNRAK